VKITPSLLRSDLYVWAAFSDEFGRDFGFRSGNVSLPKQKLPIKIRQLDRVDIDDLDKTKATLDETITTLQDRRIISRANSLAENILRKRNQNVDGICGKTMKIGK
jgi:hypothetical protein